VNDYRWFMRDQVGDGSDEITWPQAEIFLRVNP
jgi:hypothetical protein